MIIIKHDVTPSCQIGNMNFSKAATVLERIISNAGHGVADGDACQTTTAVER